MITRNEAIKRISKAKPLLHKEYGVREIGIYGSFARDEQSESSDIDILVVLEKPDYGFYAGALIYLEKLLGLKVDLIRKHSRMRESFLKRIEKEIIYV